MTEISIFLSRWFFIKLGNLQLKYLHKLTSVMKCFLVMQGKFWRMAWVLTQRVLNKQRDIITLITSFTIMLPHFCLRIMITVNNEEGINNQFGTTSKQNESHSCLLCQARIHADLSRHKDLLRCLNFPQQHVLKHQILTAYNKPDVQCKSMQKMSADHINTKVSSLL